MNLVSLVVGQSGSGKTFSCRNLGADAAILNVERKALPFRNKGVINAPINSTFRLFEAINKLRDNDSIRIVVIDSFSEWIDILLAECKNKAKGFDVWNLYNTQIFDFFQLLKGLKDKYVFVLGHTETLIDSDGEKVQRMKVKGKEHESLIEKNATCVFYSKVVRKDEGGVEYKFLSNTDGFLPCKTPYGMFPELLIDNDLLEIIKTYDNFYAEVTVDLA